MSKLLRLPLLLFLCLIAVPLSAAITIPYSFTSGTSISSTQMNANFTEIANKALDKTGDTITGNITVSNNITIDGADISDVIDGSGNVTAANSSASGAFLGAAGSTSAASYAWTGDPNTGLYSPGADQLSFTIGGTRRLGFNAAGDVLSGANIMDSIGTPTCGTNCSAIVGRDYAFKATGTFSSGTQTTVNFGHTWSTTPICTVTFDSGAVYPPSIYSLSTTAISIGATSTPNLATIAWVLCRSY